MRQFEKVVSQRALFERHIEQLTAGMRTRYPSLLLKDIPRENAEVIVKYLIAMKIEINPTRTHIQNLIDHTTIFSQASGHKPFKKITRDDVLSYLDSCRKSDSEDPLHKWLGPLKSIDDE